jgi:BirA family transcriptional regulator, biotin operon repressor / biotin---[acetyl-CoA-carboxylase] ligase
MMAIIGSEIIRLKEVDSTNRFLMDWVSREKPGEGTLVISDFQAAGRGTDGSRWESEPGQNLTFSFLLYPSFLALEAQFYLNKVISLGLADLVSNVLPGRDDIRIKWPNDIYIGNKKVAGTLIQNGIKGSKFDFCVIGIGLNVNQESFSSDAPNPVSLKIASGKSFNLEALIKQTIARIDHRYNSLKQGAIKEIDESYLGLLYRVNQLAGYIYKGNPVLAKITGVNRYGQLILELPGEKIIECDLKEIKFET